MKSDLLSFVQLFFIFAQFISRDGAKNFFGSSNKCIRAFHEIYSEIELC